MPNYTLAQLRAMQAERRYWDKRDPANADFVAQVDQGYRDLFDEPAGLVATPEQEEESRRLEEDLRRRMAQSEYWNPRHADYRRLHDDVAQGYAKLYPAAAAPMVQSEQTPPPEPVNLLELAQQMAQAQPQPAPPVVPPVHQVNPAPPADPAQRYPNPNVIREDDDDRSRRRINQENWESARRDSNAPRVAGRAPEENDNDPMHWWRMPVEGGRVRELDRQGEGHFGARRTRDNGRRLDGHGGIDIEAASGAQIVSPVDGEVEEIGTKDASQSGRRAIAIRTKDGHLFRVLYVTANDGIMPKTQVEAGRTPIGTAIDNAALYPGATGLTNHIHMEVWKDGRPRNPRPFLRRD